MTRVLEIVDPARGEVAGKFQGRLLGANVSVESLSPQLALALETTLYGAILASIYTIVASRFDQRIKALEYDYDILLHSLEVLVENKAVVEVEA